MSFELLGVGGGDAGFTAEDDCQTVAQAGDRGGILHAETTAAAVAGGVQAGDVLEVLIQNVLILVGQQTAAGAHHGADHRAEVHRLAEYPALVQRAEQVGILAEVGVHAGLGELIVAVVAGDEWCREGDGGLGG